MSNPNKITLVTVCDNNFIMLLASLIKSIEVNHYSTDDIEVYIIEDNILESNKLKFENSLKKDFISIIWLRMSEVIPKTAIIPFDKTTYPLNIYTRLFIPHFMPQDLNKVIYLDVDMIVLTDISKLWEIDIKGRTIGAVQEPFGIVGENIKNYKELNLLKHSAYFNSGLLIIDMFKWRENNITEKVLKCIKENQKFTHYPDQYGLNVILAEDWFQLDSKWNTFSNFEEEQPYLIHYIGYKPIYTDYVGNKQYLRIFNEYLSKTLWKGYIPKSKYSRYLIKLKTKIKKQLVHRFKVNF